MKKEKKILFNFRIQKELYDYILQKSENEPLLNITQFNFEEFDKRRTEILNLVEHQELLQLF